MQSQAQMSPKTNLPAEAPESAKTSRALYPEVYYKLMPFIFMTCDAILTTSPTPSQQDIDEIADNIYDEFCKLYPDMADYMKSGSSDANDAYPASIFGVGYGPGPGYGRGYRYNNFRRRGIGRDYIISLLLSQLAGRRYYYPYQYYPYY